MALALLEEIDQDLRPDPSHPQVPPLGPVQAGGQSVLRMGLTHETDGLALYPAVDTVWVAGTRVIAPEAGKVTRHSGRPNSGYSVYLDGQSGLRYYFQHLNPEGRAPVAAIKKGAKIGTVGSPSRFPGQRVAHCHLGVNAEAMVGKGGQLKYGRTGRGPNYTTGSPSIGVQLRDAAV